MAPLLTQLTNALYLVPRRARRWGEEHPDDPLIAAGATKAIRTADARRVERGASWVGARRAVLLATRTRLRCRDWEIPYDSVETAELLTFRTLLGSGFVLRLATRDGQHYQFGLQPDEAWRDLPMALTHGETRLGYSTPSVLVRVVAVVLIWAWVWSRLG